jgi:hypothetical protein
MRDLVGQQTPGDIARAPSIGTGDLSHDVGREAGQQSVDRYRALIVSREHREAESGVPANHRHIGIGRDRAARSAWSQSLVLREVRLGRGRPYAERCTGAASGLVAYGGGGRRWLLRYSLNGRGNRRRYRSFYVRLGRWSGASREDQGGNSKGYSHARSLPTLASGRRTKTVAGVQPW